MASNDSAKIEEKNSKIPDLSLDKNSINTESDQKNDALVDNSMSVYGVSKEFSHDSLGFKFEQFGVVKDITYVDVFNSGSGHAVVTMVDVDSVKAAIEKLNGTVMDGKEVIVELSKPKSLDPNIDVSKKNDASNQDEDETMIYVHGVSKSYSLKELKAKFEKFGPVITSFISGKGYAWVTMDSSNAKAAIDELNGTVIDGQKVKVDDKKPEINRELNHSAEGNKIFIFGVSASCPSYVLKKKFGQFGRVLENFNSGKGYAFITMDDECNAKAAIEELNGTTIDGQKVKVELAKPSDNGFSDRSGQNHSGRGGRQPRGRQRDFHSSSVAKENSDRRSRSIRSFEDGSTTTSTEDEDEPVREKRNSKGSKAPKSVETSKPHRKSRLDRSRSPLSHTSDSAGRLSDQDWGQLVKLKAQKKTCLAGMEEEDEIIHEATQRREAKNQTLKGIQAQIKCLREKHQKEVLKYQKGSYHGGRGGRGDRWGQPRGNRRAGGED